jgi:predicted RNase H-like HicB family nuclease
MSTHDTEARDEQPFHVIKDGIVYELEAEDGGGYVITVPALPGCMSAGDTIDEALSMIRDAMELWLDAAREQGASIPQRFEHLQRAS